MNDDDFWGHKVTDDSLKEQESSGIGSGSSESPKSQKLATPPKVTEITEKSEVTNTQLDVQKLAESTSATEDGSHYSDDSFESDSDSELADKSESEHEENEQKPKSPSQKSISISTRAGTPWLKTEETAPNTKPKKSKPSETGPKEKKTVKRVQQIATKHSETGTKIRKSKKPAVPLAVSQEIPKGSQKDPRLLLDQNIQLKNKLEEAMAENITLLRIQKRQEAALNRLERQPTRGLDTDMADRYNEELRVQKEQIRLQREKMREQERLLRERNDQMEKYSDKARRLEKVLKDKGINAKKIKKETKETDRLKDELTASQQRIKDLERQLLLLSKNHKHQLNIEVARHKSTTKRLQVLEGNSETTKKKEKEKIKMPQKPKSLVGTARLQDSLEDLIANDKDLEIHKSKYVDKTPRKPKKAAKEKQPELTSSLSSSDNSILNKQEPIEIKTKHETVTQSTWQEGKTERTLSLRHDTDKDILASLRRNRSADQTTYERKIKPTEPPKDFGSIDLLSFGVDTKRQPRNDVDPFEDLKGSKSTKKDKAANGNLMDELFGPQTQQTRGIRSGEHKNSKKLSDFTDDDLANHKPNNIDHDSHSKSTAKPLIDSKLFPWEKDQANNTKATKSSGTQQPPGVPTFY